MLTLRWCGSYRFHGKVAAGDARALAFRGGEIDVAGSSGLAGAQRGQAPARPPLVLLCTLKANLSDMSSPALVIFCADHKFVCLSLKIHDRCHMEKPRFGLENLIGIAW